MLAAEWQRDIRTVGMEHSPVHEGCRWSHTHRQTRVVRRGAASGQAATWGAASHVVAQEGEVARGGVAKGHTICRQGAQSRRVQMQTYTHADAGEKRRSKRAGSNKCSGKPCSGIGRGGSLQRGGKGTYLLSVVST